MTILLLDQFADLGGAQRCLLDLLPAIEQAGWKAHAALPASGPLVERLTQHGVRTHPLQLPQYSLGRKSVWDGVRFLADARRMAAEIRALADEVDPSVIYVNGPRLMPAVARARGNIPIVFHAHNVVTPGNGAAILRQSLRKANATVIAASQFLARTLPGMRASVVYSGVENCVRVRIPSPVPRIGMIARITPQKCQKEFVQAAGRIPAAEFVVCGDVVFGDRRGERYRNELLASAPSNVRFLGWREDIFDVLASLDLLVMPSEGEGGVPRVILEAFAGRVPVLALASGAVPEVVIEGENGFLLRSPVAAEIARRLQELLPQSARLAEVAERAHRLWQKKFTVERYREEVWDVVNNCWKTNAAAKPAAAAPSRAAG